MEVGCCRAGVGRRLMDRLQHDRACVSLYFKPARGAQSQVMAGESQSLSTTSNPTTSSPIPTTSSATMTEVNEGTVHAADRAPTTQATSRPRRNFQIPAVALGQEHFLSRSLAANLASCLLKHILFLKSQIPLCVQGILPPSVGYSRSVTIRQPRSSA